MSGCPASRDSGNTDPSKIIKAIGGLPILANGQILSPTERLLGYLEAFTALGAALVRLNGPAGVLAFSIRLSTASYPLSLRLVQYPAVDDPWSGEELADAITWAVDLFDANHWPCLIAHIVDGGTLDIWPAVIRTEANDPTSTESTHHTYCLTHGTITRLPAPGSAGHTEYSAACLVCRRIGCNGECCLPEDLAFAG